MNRTNPKCNIVKRKRQLPSTGICLCSEAKVNKSYDIKCNINSLLERFKDKNIDLKDSSSLNNNGDYFEKI